MPKRRLKFETPPPVVAPAEKRQQTQLETPQRAAVFSVLYYCQQKEIPCHLKDIEEVFNIRTSTASDILKSKRARRLQHSDAPDTRGALRELTNSAVNVLADHINNAPFEEKGLPWEEFAWQAGVTPAAANIKGKEDGWHHDTIQKRVTELTGIKTYKAAVKEDHPLERREERIEWCTRQLELRPHGRDWRVVIWLDKLHWMTGPQYMKNIKRRPGQRFSFKNDCIEYNKNVRRDPLNQEHFHVLTVVGYNFRWARSYNAGNKNGKMKSKLYIKIMKELMEETRGRELVLYHDRDSAHLSKMARTWLDQNGVDVLKGCSKSPNLSVMETWVKPIREKFYQRSCFTAEDGIKRFYRVFDSLKDEKINRTIDLFPARLSETIRAQGRATKY